jgi:hypothetical protein
MTRIADSLGKAAGVTQSRPGGIPERTVQGGRVHQGSEPCMSSHKWLVTGHPFGAVGEDN